MSVETLTKTGRAVRVTVTLVVVGLLVASALWGEDDHFPFAPFKMYAGAADPDAPTVDTRLEAVDAEGDEFLLNRLNAGVRRAELEGQRSRFERDPSLLASITDAYHKRNPQAPRLQEVRIVVRWHEVRDFEVTGEYDEEVVATWQP